MGYQSHQENGWRQRHYRAQLSETCKVKGDDFYLDANGSPILPLGTITIEETSAVKGYNKDNNFTNGDVR